MGLYEKLSPEDLYITKRYCTLYGEKAKVTDESLKTFLSEWDRSKNKLYRLLGNSMTHSFVYHKNVNNAYRKREISAILRGYFGFFSDLDNFFYYFGKKLREKSTAITSNTLCNTNFDNPNMWAENKIGKSIKYIVKSEDGKTKTLLQISENEKPIRAILKILDASEKYYNGSDEAKEDNIQRRKILDEIRCKISTVPKEGTIDTPVVISILPMDFMTMSDNDSDWQSCMSWMHEGCYHAGTIEMMNSNNVVCAFIPSTSKDFVFDSAENTSWNNKNWRCLFYVEKDIICSGKAYPYKDTELVKLIISELRKLAEKNMHWTYTEDIAEYSDMKGKDNIGAMNNVVGTKKHKVIVFDTKAMYNDMFNDQEYTFWCVRNKVKKSKKISISGKALCLECGGTLCPKSDKDCDEGYDSYNSRYSNPGNVICRTCYSKKTCSHCLSIGDLFEYNGERYCKSCLMQLAKICPHCGKTLYPILPGRESYRTVKVGITDNLHNILADEPYMFDLYNSIEEAIQCNINPIDDYNDKANNDNVGAVFFHEDCWEHSPLHPMAVSSKRRAFCYSRRYIDSSHFSVKKYIDKVTSIINIIKSYCNNEITDLDKALEENQNENY